ncbi:MAG: sigma-54 interaction domain-containing protein [Candidatus Krumholzibacteriia bacterium]
MTTSPTEFDPPIAGASPAIARLKRLIIQVADSPASVLITGESGTGKELVARNLHARSRRGGNRFVPVNCTALNPGVLESELFGHGRGSFTGAIRSHSGLFEQANGGTLFLDEISEVPPFVQAKLLRVLQDREIRPMGASEARHVDVRIVAATNASLEQRIEQGSFRLDLFYRLAVVELEVAPLRERLSDIFDFIEHFFGLRGLRVPKVCDKTRQVLMQYHWPGNVRELQNEMERILAFHPGVREIAVDMLSRRVRKHPCRDTLDVKLLHDAPLPQAVGYLEENLLRKTLTQTNWNKSESARQLGLSRQGLLKKIKRYGITNEPDDVWRGDVAE